MSLLPVSLSYQVVPVQPVQGIPCYVYVQNTLPVQNTFTVESTLPAQKSYPMQNTLQLPNTLTLQNTLPVQNTLLVQNTLPVQSSLITQHSLPVEANSKIFYIQNNNLNTATVVSSPIVLPTLDNSVILQNQCSIVPDIRVESCGNIENNYSGVSNTVQQTHSESIIRKAELTSTGSVSPSVVSNTIVRDHSYIKILDAKVNCFNDEGTFVFVSNDSNMKQQGNVEDKQQSFSTTESVQTNFQSKNKPVNELQQDSVINAETAQNKIHVKTGSDFNKEDIALNDGTDSQSIQNAIENQSHFCRDNEISHKTASNKNINHLDIVSSIKQEVGEKSDHLSNLNDERVEDNSINKVNIFSSSKIEMDTKTQVELSKIDIEESDLLVSCAERPVNIKNHEATELSKSSRMKLNCNDDLTRVEISSDMSDTILLQTKSSVSIMPGCDVNIETELDVINTREDLEVNSCPKKLNEHTQIEENKELSKHRHCYHKNGIGCHKRNHKPDLSQCEISNLSSNTNIKVKKEVTETTHRKLLLPQLPFSLNTSCDVKIEKDLDIVDTTGDNDADNCVIRSETSATQLETKNRHFHHGNGNIFECVDCSCEYRNELFEGKLYQCDRCSYSTNHYRSYINHNMRHESHQVYYCANCEYKAKTKRCLSRHIIFRHKSLKFECSDCDYKAPYYRLLHAHINAVHAKKPEFYKCPLCKFRTKQKYYIKRHVTVVHLQTNEEFSCPICDYTSPIKFYFDRHMMYNHSDKQKTYDCDKCDYKTKKKTDIVLHFRKRHKK